MKYLNKLLCIVLLASQAYALEGEPPKVVKDQLDKISPNIEKARLEYARIVKIENEKLIKNIEAALSKETKSGNLDNAIALKAALEKAKNGEYVNGLLSVDYGDLLGDAGSGVKKVDIDVPATGCSQKIQVTGKIRITPDSKSKWNTSPSRWTDVDFRGHTEVGEMAANGMPYMQLCYRMGEGKLVLIKGPTEVELNGIMVFCPSDMEGGGSVDNNTGSIKVTIEGSASVIKQ